MMWDSISGCLILSQRFDQILQIFSKLWSKIRTNIAKKQVLNRLSRPSTAEMFTNHSFEGSLLHSFGASIWALRVDAVRALCLFQNVSSTINQLSTITMLGTMDDLLFSHMGFWPGTKDQSHGVLYATLAIQNLSDSSKRIVDNGRGLPSVFEPFIGQK